MFNKKNVVIILLTSAMICGMGFAINTTMSYAKDYDHLKANNVTNQEATSKVTNRTKMTINGVEYQVDYADGVDFEEGITVQKAIEKSILQMETEHPGKVDTNIYIWDYGVEDRTSSLESQASWGIYYKIRIPVSPTRKGAMNIEVEVDKYTGTCIQAEYIAPRLVSIGEYSVYLKGWDGRLDANEGITIEKAIEAIEEKTKEIFNSNLTKKEISVGANSTASDQKDIWNITAITNDGIVSAAINKFTGEIISLDFQSDTRYSRTKDFYNNRDTDWDSDIDAEANFEVVQAEISKYLNREKDSKYHQVAIDFVNTYHLNQDATIKNVQTIVEHCDFLHPVVDEITGPKYVVEVELGTGEYIIVTIEKETDTPFGYYKTSLSFKERLALGAEYNKEDEELRKERGE